MKQQKKVAELLLVDRSGDHPWTGDQLCIFAAAWCKSGRISQDHAFRNVCR